MWTCWANVGFRPLFKFRPFLENFISTRTATYPGNTMIKRMQSNGAGGKPKVYSGAIDCLRQILQKEGVGGATLFAPLEMLNEGDLFPGTLLKKWKNDPARLVSAAFPGFQRIHSPCEFFRQRALWWSDFLWHCCGHEGDLFPEAPLSKHKKRPCWLLEKAHSPCESSISEWWFLISFRGSCAQVSTVAWA
eukprot:COSAG04_NODE_541_length_12866_cov_847.972351_2_plen_191_part_00